MVAWNGLLDTFLHLNNIQNPMLSTWTDLGSLSNFSCIPTDPYRVDNFNILKFRCPGSREPNSGVLDVFDEFFYNIKLFDSIISKKLYKS